MEAAAVQEPEGRKGQSTWSWILEFASEHKGDYVLSIALAICCVLCQVLPYVVMARIVRDLVEGERNLDAYLARLGLMALLYVGSAIFHALSTSTSHRATFYVLGSMRKRTLDKLARMPLGAVISQTSGALKSIIVERIDSVETTLAHIIPEFTSNLLGSLFVLVLLFMQDWHLALVSLVTLPVGLVCMAGMMKDYDVHNQECVDKVKTLNHVAVEYIDGIEVIKVFGREEGSSARFAEVARDAATTYVEWMRTCNAYFAMMMAVLPATLVAVLPVGGLLMRAGTLDAGTFITCIILAMGLMTPIITVASYTDDLAAIDVTIHEVTKILEAPEQVRPGKTEALPRNNTVRLSDVHFSYGETEVLHGISLEAREGETCALVGPSGSGKSTIARLVSGLWDAGAGTVSIGGVDVRNMSEQDFNARVSYVSQDAYLFNETVRENIRMGRPDASDAEVERIARAAGCHDFIMGLEHGYDTVVGTGGGRLSGGERQRVAIARAMLKLAPIVVLDEATAYTDPENEALVERSVSSLVKGKTLIVIAHRLSTIQHAAHIVVIDRGGVAEEGTHDELLARHGLYERMWQAHLSVRDNLAEGGGKR